MSKRKLLVALLSLVIALGMLRDAVAAELAHLRKMVGQYTDVLLADPALDAELHSILGEDFAGFMSVMQVVFPTTIVDGRFLVAEGCRAHDCGNHGGLVIVDLDAGTVMALRRGLYGFIIGSPSLEAVLANWRGQ